MAKILLYPALAICLLASCKKSEEKKFIGDWLQTEWADDGNHNKVMDASEVRKSPTGAMYETIYTFQSDDELKVLWGDVYEYGKWRLQNGDDELVLTMRDGRQLKHRIVSVDDTKLQLEMVGDSTIYWQTLTKQ